MKGKALLLSKLPKLQQRDLCQREGSGSGWILKQVLCHKASVPHGENQAAFAPMLHLTKNEEVQKFKSGMVLMAVTAKKPIIPIYIKVRKNILKRQYIIIGEPINPAELLPKIPSLSDMDKIAEILREKEKELKTIADSIK